MRRYGIWVAYEGTKYGGWQRQPSASTVAGTIEAALHRLLGSEVRLTGAGRTDAGVHAWGQVAHWDTPNPLPSPFLPRINALLPGDIRILALYEGQEGFHARHSALTRTYRYYIHFYPDPFRRYYSLWVPEVPSLAILQEAASILKGKNDFAAFSKKLDLNKPSICEVYQAHWREDGSGVYYFEIEANRFLRAMVRALVGAQIRLAQGRLCLLYTS
ncbi:MAG: tRNA pseudouridine(38-40) synthase TruA, partial [Bacteroidia bacterium]|nr:tRNA pseudouridine(38-40) synthase TruA [Bacteroidia bacterium]